MESLVMLSKKSMIIVFGILCLVVAWMTGTGDILNYIDFADPLNEMGFFIAATCLGGMSLYVGFTK